MGIRLVMPDQTPEDVAEERISAEGTASALCTHGDVIADVLVALADEEYLDLGLRPRQSKGSAWVLDAEDGRFVKATYLAARD